MRVEVLISCMHQTDVPSLIKRTNIQSDVLVVNQCNEEKSDSFEFQNLQGETCKARIIHTTERGLSRSRNMAIKNASGDLCLICDDDIKLEDQYVGYITKAFQENPNDSIIVFKINYHKKQCPDKPKKINIFSSSSISSVQIVFNRNKLNCSIFFCEKMGSGTGNGGGEENKFLVDCIKAGHNIKYVPYLISTVYQSKSLWFNGFDKQYWHNRGWVAKMIYGYLCGYLYLWYTLLFRCYKLDKENKWIDILIWMHKGFFDNK